MPPTTPAPTPVEYAADVKKLYEEIKKIQKQMMDEATEQWSIVLKNLTRSQQVQIRNIEGLKSHYESVWEFGKTLEMEREKERKQIEMIKSAYDAAIAASTRAAEQEIDNQNQINEAKKHNVLIEQARKEAEEDVFMGNTDKTEAAKAKAKAAADEAKAAEAKAAADQTNTTLAAEALRKKIEANEAKAFEEYILANDEDREKTKKRNLEKIADYVQINKELEKTKQANDEIITKLQVQYDIAIKLEPLNKSITQYQADAAKSGGNMAKNLLGIKDTTSRILSETRNMADLWTKMKATAAGFAVGFQDAFRPDAILKTFIDTTIQAALAYDDLEAKLAALTGRQGVYSDTMWSSVEGLRSFGITMAQAGEATFSSYKNMAKFAEQSASGKKELIALTAQMSMFGVSMDTVAKIQDNLMTGLKMSRRESKDWQLQLFNMASSLEVDQATVTSAFEQSFAELSVYVKKTIDVFRGLQAAARGVGLGVQQLQGIFGRTLDTFDSTAQMAGKLNTILGRDMLNSVDLLFATETQRHRMLIESLELSGKQWKSMSKFERIAVASAAGIKDMNVAQRIFNQSLSEFDTQQAKVAKAAASQEKFNKAVKSSRTFMVMLKEAYQNFAIAVQPVVDVLVGVVAGISNLLSVGTYLREQWGEWVGGIAQIVTAVGTLMGVLSALNAILVLTGLKATYAWGALLLPLVKVMAVLAALYLVVKGISKFFDWMGWSRQKTDEYSDANARLQKTLTKKSSPAFWELPQYMARNVEQYNTQLTKTVPTIEKLSHTSSKLHTVQTKPGSPPLWSLPQVMSENLEKYSTSVNKSVERTDKFVKISDGLNKQVSTSSQITNGFNSLLSSVSDESVNSLEKQSEKLTQISTNFTHANSSSIFSKGSKSVSNSSILNNTEKTIETIVTQVVTKVHEQMATRRHDGNSVKVDVNFMDIDATRRSFQEAVVQALQKTYG